MADHFDSPRSLLDRARDHTNDLDARIKAFFQGKVCARVVDYDRETGQDVYKVRLTARLPGSLAAVLKDATGNMRDALDHATYASAVTLGNPNPKNTGFPFARDAAGVAGELESKRLRDIPAEIRPFLISLDPHEAGNRMLWALNKIRNTKTHRLLVPLGMLGDFSEITGPGGTVKPPAQIGYCRWDPAKYEVEYMRLGRGSVFHHDIKVAYNVTLGEVDVIGGQPVIPTLNTLAGEVESVIRGLEAETTRILQSRA